MAPRSRTVVEARRSREGDRLTRRGAPRISVARRPLAERAIELRLFFFLQQFVLGIIEQFVVAQRNRVLGQNRKPIAIERYCDPRRLGAARSGSDGTRTRDLRRDR